MDLAPSVPPGSPSPPPLPPPLKDSSPPQAWASRLRVWVNKSTALHAGVIIAMATGLIVLAVVQAVAIARIRLQATHERAALVRRETEILTAQTAALLRLSALPLGWAVRGAMLKDDMGSVDTYLQRIVQEPHVTGAALVGPDGKVRLASNRKLENRPAAELFSGVALNGQSPFVMASEGSARVVVPVMGYDRRLGTLILSYLAPTAEALEVASPTK